MGSVLNSEYPCCPIKWNPTKSCADPEGRIGGPDPTGKSQVIWVSLEVSFWTPPRKTWTPLENVGPPLDPWERIVFTTLKP